MRLSSRVENLAPYFSVRINEKIATKMARGEEVISFAIGDPDIPTPDYLIDELCRAANNPDNHRYPDSGGIPELRQSIANWYRKRFGVVLDQDNEVLPLIGAKEGIAHIALCLVEKGDIALIPDPGYPVYSSGAAIAGGQVYYLTLNEGNSFFPDLDSIPENILEKAKVLWLNYPNNPTGATVEIDCFNRAVEFARRHDIAVCHDGPYTEVAYDSYRTVSFMEAEGAREVAIEFHSFSKSYNMAGWRIGMAVGNAHLINALRRMKSNLDSGIPKAIQKMAVAALNGPQKVIEEHNVIYQRRRDKLVQTLNSVGILTRPPRASLYVWARVPPKYSSAELAEELLEQVGIVVTPGTAYGPSGEGYVRLSLTVPDELLEKGVKKLKQFIINK